MSSETHKTPEVIQELVARYGAILTDKEQRELRYALMSIPDTQFSEIYAQVDRKMSEIQNTYHKQSVELESERRTILREAFDSIEGVHTKEEASELDQLEQEFN